VQDIDSVNTIQQNRVKYAKYFDNKDKDTLSIDTFYKLLMAEMSNQDPMEPVSNTEFISQMATFTSLQTQQEALYYSNANYAQAMVGKTVIVMGDAGANFQIQTGVVSKVNFSEGEFMVTVNEKQYSLKNVMEVLDGGYGIAGGSDGAFATSLIGKYVTVGVINQAGDAVVEEGVVQHVEIKDGQISVIIDNIAYPLYSVAKIEEYTGQTKKVDDEDEEDEEEEETPAPANTAAKTDPSTTDPAATDPSTTDPTATDPSATPASGDEPMSDEDAELLAQLLQMIAASES